jgi:hypothetical protein
MKTVTLFYNHLLLKKGIQKLGPSFDLQLLYPFFIHFIKPSLLKFVLNIKMYDVLHKAFQGVLARNKADLAQ